MSTTQRDYYEVLGVPRTASQKEIKAAFRRLARTHHPDVNPNHPDAVSRFRGDQRGPRGPGRSREAPQVRRAGPSLAGARGLGAGRASGRRTVRPGRRRPVPHRLARGPGGPVRLGQPVLGVLPRHVRPRSGRSCRRRLRRRRRPRPGHRDRDLRLPGGGVPGDHPGLRAGGRQGPATRRLRIPPGVREGSRLRLAGQGGPGAGGAPAGDLFAWVRVQPHPTFTREGDDLRVRVPVPLDVALLGGEVEVPTLRGRPVALRIPPETQNRARLRLRGLGMPRLDGSGAGDLYAETDVRLPVPLSPELKEMATHLRRRAGAGRGS